MDDDQQFCLRWNNHQSTLISVFDTLLENGTLVDCTLAAEGKFLKAHKVVLSACSPYFATLLSEQYDKHPIFILKDVKYQELRAMMDYMYRGEVNISQDQLAALLKAAESLQIKGLSDNRAGSSGGQKPTAAEHKNLSVPGKMSGAGGGYTLEQTKRARLGPSSVESQELSGSREGSSSPTSRKRRKVRRRSVENVMADNHDNSNSSQSMQINSSAGTLSNATGAITSVATIVTTGVPSSSIPITTSGSASTIAANVTKKTESVSKLVNTDVISTDNEQDDEINEKIIHHGQVRKEQNHHKRASKLIASGNMGDVCKDGSEIAIEPKSEYDDGNDETVEDLTLDDEDIGLEDLDQTAGPSHGGEGSSQGYAQWQVDRSHDEVYMATQEAQQRDPQDLSTKLNKSVTVTSNILPVIKQPNSKKQTTVTPAVAAATQIRSNGKKRLSMSDVSDMLLEFYKANTAKAPKNENLEKHVRQSSPSSADGAAPPPITPTNGDDVSQSKIPNEPTTITSNIDTASKNLNGDETAIDESHSKKNNNMPFHPRIKYSSVKNKNTTPPMPAKPTAIVEDAADIDKHQTPAQILTSIIPTGILSSTPPSVIKPPVITNPAALAAAIFRDGYHTFQQQLRAHEFIKQSIAPCENSQKVSDNVATHQHIQDNAQLVNVQHYLSKENRSSEYDEGSDDYDSGDGEDDDDDDDEDGRYPAFDDIHLIEGSKLNYTSQMNLSSGAEYLSDESSQKYNMMAAQALRNLEFSLNDFGGNPGEEPLYQCRHCGKKYRWKSTLRRHENVECGGKEPSHQCPYCPYKSKQRGNLGVHVRKHHSNLPQLASKRRSKYSQGGNDLSNGSVKDEKE